MEDLMGECQCKIILFRTYNIYKHLLLFVIMLSNKTLPRGWVNILAGADCFNINRS